MPVSVHVKCLDRLKVITKYGRNTTIDTYSLSLHLVFWFSGHRDHIAKRILFHHSLALPL